MLIDAEVCTHSTLDAERAREHARIQRAKPRAVLRAPLIARQLEALRGSGAHSREARVLCMGTAQTRSSSMHIA